MIDYVCCGLACHILHAFETSVGPPWSNSLTPTAAHKNLQLEGPDGRSHELGSTENRTGRMGTGVPHQLVPLGVLSILV